MSDRSGCQFELTYEGLQECLSALDRQETLSTRESLEGRALFDTFLRWCWEQGIIVGFDRRYLDSLFNELTNGR